jgi:excisionase family DNA binding protein
MSEIVITTKEDLRKELKLLLRNILMSPASDTREAQAASRVDVVLSRVQYLTTRQVADVLNVTPQTVRNWTHEGRLAPRRTGIAERYHVDDVRDLLADRWLAPLPDRAGDGLSDKKLEKPETT